MTETSDVSSEAKRTLHYYVYVLFSYKDRGFYIGYTTDLKTRLTSHAKGHVTATKFRLPVLLIHYEYFIQERDAKAREEYLKSGYGRRNTKEMLKQTLVSII